MQTIDPLVELEPLLHIRPVVLVPAVVGRARRARHVGTPVPLPVLRELLEPVVPAYGIALAYVERVADRDHARRLPRYEPRVALAVQGALVVQPLPQARIARDVVRPVLLAEPPQVLEPLLPRPGLRLGPGHRPREAQRFEASDAFGVQVLLVVATRGRDRPGRRPVGRRRRRRRGGVVVAAVDPRPLVRGVPSVVSMMVRVQPLLSQLE